MPHDAIGDELTHQSKVDNFRSVKAALLVKRDKSLGDADLVFPEASGLTLMSAQTFASPASRGIVAASSTIFPANRFGVEGRRCEEEDIMVIGCARRHKVGQ